jgi:uroporphyrinogen-III synthase
VKRVLITRPQNQAEGFADQLRLAGFEPVFFPVIDIQPVKDSIWLDRAIQKLACFDWIVFTSVNGVAVFWDRLRDLDSLTFPSQLKVAAIGPKTAEALTAHGVRVSFIPDEYVAEAILPGLGDLRGRWVLLPRAEIARKNLPDAIVRAGGLVQEVAVYHTLPVEPDPASIAALRAGVEMVTFTSPSTVHSFIEIANRSGLDAHHLPGDPLIACIGPITAITARESGYENCLVAQEYTTAGLISLLRGMQEGKPK